MRRRKPIVTLSERLLKFAGETRRAAGLLRPGKERETLLRKARRTEEAAGDGRTAQCAVDPVQAMRPFENPGYAK